MQSSPLTTVCARTLAAQVTAGEVSAREAVTAALDAIACNDAVLHAFVTLCPDDALAQADAIDAAIARGEPAGPLAGVPVGIKDLLFTAGLRTTFGSAHYASFVPDEDDIAVARLRAAGAIVVGKTNTSEFGYGAVPRNALFPPTHNPWNPALGPGGSSAGSAAAVAGGMVPLALGSDGGGSIRVPAALTGLVGFKPSFGRIPVYPGCRDHRLPGVSSWESLEHIGPLTRTVADARLAYEVMAGPDPRDRHSLPHDAHAADSQLRPLRIAYSPDFGFATVDSEVASICDGSIHRFAATAGAALDRDQPMLGDLQSTFEALVALDTDRSGLKRMRETSGLAFGPALTALVDSRWTLEQFSDALLERKRVARVMSAFFERWDLLATPATAAAAVPLSTDHPETIGGRAAGAAAFTPFSAIANLTGQPAISLPAGLTADGRPVGLQLIGPHLGDALVLAAAEAFEAAMPFPSMLDKSPPAGQSLSG